MKVCCATEEKMQAMTAAIRNKKGVIKLILLLGILQVITGIVSIACWSAMFVEAKDAYYKKGGLYSAAGIWGGAIALFPGIISIVIGIPSIDINARINGVFWLLGAGITLLSISSQNIRFSNETLNQCKELIVFKTPEFCFWNQDLMKNMSTVCLVMGGFHAMSALGNIAFYTVLVCTAGRKIDRAMNAQFQNPPAAGAVVAPQQYQNPPVAGAVIAPQQYQNPPVAGAVVSPPQYQNPPAVVSPQQYQKPAQYPQGPEAPVIDAPPAYTYTNEPTKY